MARVFIPLGVWSRVYEGKGKGMNLCTLEEGTRVCTATAQNMEAHDIDIVTLRNIFSHYWIINFCCQICIIYHLNQQYWIIQLKITLSSSGKLVNGKGIPLGVWSRVYEGKGKGMNLCTLHITLTLGQG